MGGEWQFTDFYNCNPWYDSRAEENNYAKEKPSLKQFTDITVLLDRSGSMSSIKGAMEEAFNGFIKTHRAVPSTKISLVQFDSQNDQEIVYQCVPVCSVETLDLQPRGGTPLVDAFVKVIDRTGERLKNMKESDRPDQVLIVVITDGEENMSRTFKKHNVEERVKNQTNKYNWQFTYLGANQDAIAEARSYGINPNFAMSYLATYTGTTASANALSSNTMNYVLNTDRGNDRAMKFSNKQRLESMAPDTTTTTKADDTTDKL